MFPFKAAKLQKRLAKVEQEGLVPRAGLEACQCADMVIMGQLEPRNPIGKSEFTNLPG